MIADKLISDLSKNSFVIINKDELNKFLSEAQIIKEENTYLCDFIRLLSYKENIIVQELSNKNEIIIRRFNSLKEAEEFIQERLDYYDRKWDGCGCKVDYYS